MIVNYFSQVHNEGRLIPYVFRHYDNIVDHYYIWDHASTDRTKELLLQNPKVTVFDLPESPFDEEQLIKFKNTTFKEFKQDWAIIADFDEFLYHEDILELLTWCKIYDITIVRSEGYQMFSDAFPKTDKQIYEVVSKGIRNKLYDKSIIISNEVNPNYSYGAHFINPSGKVKYSYETVKLLHYKVFGKEFITDMLNRNETLSDNNKRLGLSVWKDDLKYPCNPRLEYENLKQNAYEIL